MQLLVDVMGALIHDTQRPKHSTFHVAVAVADWISREDTMRRLFDPARSYADTFAWVRESLHNLAESEIPATIARWLTNVYDEDNPAKNYTTPGDVTPAIPASRINRATRFFPHRICNPSRSSACTRRAP